MHMGSDGALFLLNGGLLIMHQLNRQLLLGLQVLAEPVWACLKSNRRWFSLRGHPNLQFQLLASL